MKSGDWQSPGKYGKLCRRTCIFGENLALFQLNSAWNLRCGRKGVMRLTMMPLYYSDFHWSVLVSSNARRQNNRCWSADLDWPRFWTKMRKIDKRLRRSHRRRDNAENVAVYRRNFYDIVADYHSLRWRCRSQNFRQSLRHPEKMK